MDPVQTSLVGGFRLFASTITSSLTGRVLEYNEVDVKTRIKKPIWCREGGKKGRVQDFMERGFICIKVWGFDLLILSHFLKYPMKMKQFGLPETKLFHFHMIFKKRGRKGVQASPLNHLWIRLW